MTTTPETVKIMGVEIKPLTPELLRRFAPNRPWSCPHCVTNDPELSIYDHSPPQVLDRLVGALRETFKRIPDRIPTGVRVSQEVLRGEPVVQVTMLRAGGGFPLWIPYPEEKHAELVEYLQTRLPKALGFE